MSRKLKRAHFVNFGRYFTKKVQICGVNRYFRTLRLNKLVRRRGGYFRSMQSKFQKRMFFLFVWTILGQNLRYKESRAYKNTIVAIAKNLSLKQ